MNLTTVAWWVVVLGAVNVGLAALSFDVVELFLGGWPQLVQIVNLLIGVAGVYYLLTTLSGGKSKRKK